MVSSRLESAPASGVEGDEGTDEEGTAVVEVVLGRIVVEVGAGVLDGVVAGTDVVPAEPDGRLVVGATVDDANSPVDVDGDDSSADTDGEPVSGEVLGTSFSSAASFPVSSVSLNFVTSALSRRSVPWVVRSTSISVS